MKQMQMRRLGRALIPTAAVFAALLSAAQEPAAPPAPWPLERCAEQWASGQAFFESGDLAAARKEFESMASQELVPPYVRSMAQLRIAQSFAAEQNLDAAKVEYAKVAAIAGAPKSHLREAEQCLQEIERLASGLPGRDPAASRTRLAERPAPAVSLYVAPSGSDAASGGQDVPLATLEGARDALRKLRQVGALPAGGATVFVHGGEYKVTQPFTLGAEDAGTETAPILYRAVEGETPVFSGGIRIEGFRPVEDPAILARLVEEARGAVLQLDLKPYGLTDLKPLRLGGFAGGLGFKTHPVMELFFDGQAMPMARWPNEGFVRVADVSVKDGLTSHGREGSKIGRFFYEGNRPERWQDDKNILLYGYWFWDWADSYERVVSIDTATHEIALEEPYHNYGYRKDAPYCAMNLLSEIDRPGEWYLDRAASTLYFYPPSDPAQAVVELSVADFPLVQVENASYVTFQGLTWELGGVDGVLIRGGGHCLLAGCTVRRCGGTGVVVQGGSGHGVLACDVYSMGRSGIEVSGGDRKTLTPGGHFVENCHVYELSRIDHTYTPAVHLFGVGNRIAHNLLHNIPSSAMRIEGNDHVIELNDVHHVVEESDDQGGADMFGNPTYRGNVYRYNYWHDITGAGEPGCGRAGIRLDDAISGVSIYGNVFYRCGAGKLGFGGVQIHGGKDNVVDNNAFVACMAAVSFSPWGEKRWRDFVANSMNAPEIDPALYLERYPELARLAEDHDVNLLCRNLVYRCDEFLLRDGSRDTLMGNALVENATDGTDGVFHLSDLTPMLERAGLAPIPFDEIGLYKTDLRR